MPSEVEARIAWGFMAQPGDPFARTLCTALGPREALARVVGNGSVSRVTAGIALEGTPLTAVHRERLKASYDPDTVRRSMVVQERAGIIALEQSHPDWPETLHDLGDAAHPQGERRPGRLVCVNTAPGCGGQPSTDRSGIGAHREYHRRAVVGSCRRDLRGSHRH